MSISLFSLCLIIKHYQAGYKCQIQKPLFTKKTTLNRSSGSEHE